MIRRPPRSTRTDTLFPYTTLFRSQVGIQFAAVNGQQAIPGELDADSPQGRQIARIHTHHLGQVVAEIAPQRAQQIVAEEAGGGIYLAVLRHRLLRQQERLHVVIGGDEAIDLRPRGREIVLDLQRDRRTRLGLVKVEGDVVDQVVELVGIELDDGDDAVKVKPRRLVGLQRGAEGGAVVGGDIQRGQGGDAVYRDLDRVVGFLGSDVKRV